ncbi:type II CAAX endopeptidase family protein [Paenibacillus thermotolerans]|uniref:type II CAAX endopeptidase family protein n=1 Tax=Paenibacillus thermotolerans TaxID=3027807 RepID=UPI002368D8B4|nr:MULTISPECIES: type II CAAX endopeptidase family protein [unclassified Paenibacillus]
MNKLTALSHAKLYVIIALVSATIMGMLKFPGQIYMFSPMIAVLIMLLITGELFKRKGWTRLGLHKAGFKYWGLAIVAPIAVLGIAYAVLWATPFASFQIPDGITTAMLLMLPVKLLIALAIYTVTSSLGEEIGWRGYLLPKLSGIGWRKAMLLIGIVHGAFHLPIMIFGDYHAAGNPWIVLPMFFLSTILISFVFGITRISTGSVWPAAIMHAVHNVAWAAFGEFTAVHSETAEYIGGESGIVVIALYSAIAIWLMKREKRALAAPVAAKG